MEPLSLNPQDPFISVSIGLGIVSGNHILSEKVARLAKMLFNSESSSEISFTISSLELTPPGVTHGPAIIDQLKDIKIKIDQVRLKGAPSLVDH